MTAAQPNQPSATAISVDALLDLTQSLSRIVEAENLALTENRPHDLAPLQAEKARLAADYARSVRGVATARTAIAGADPDVLARLRTQTEAFEARVARQRKLLDTLSPTATAASA